MPATLTPNALDELSRFAAASQTQLQERSLLRRSEDKFLLPSSLLTRFLYEQRENYCSIQQPADSVYQAVAATYETRYFDTDTLTIYQMVQQSKAHQKIRLRRYVDRRLCFLEIKQIETNGVSSKVRLARSYEHDLFDRHDQQFLKKHVQDVNLKRLNLQVIATYVRITFLAKNAIERMTIDLGLRYHLGIRSHYLCDTVIVEIKRPKREQKSLAADWMIKTGVYPSAFSKYTAGLLLPDSGQDKTGNNLGKTTRKATQLKESG